MIFSLGFAWRRTGVDARVYPCGLILLALVCGSLPAEAQFAATVPQGSLSAALDLHTPAAGSGLASSGPSLASMAVSDPHRFFDAENGLLLAGVAGLSAADFVVTRTNLRAGGRELNPVTRLFGSGTAGLAVNFAGETAAIVGLSYYFHRRQHHRLERLTSMLDIGTSAFAVGYDLKGR